MPDPTVNSWSFGVQRDIGYGFVLEAAYVGNNSHHANGTNFNQNGISPDTVWSPNGGTCATPAVGSTGTGQLAMPGGGYCTGSLNPIYVNPVATSTPLPINLVRSFPGFYNGIADITTFTANGGSTYNSLQEQLNKRFGKSVRFSSNWTWQKTTETNPNQYLPSQLVKVVSGRKQVVNIQLNYSVPSATRFLGKSWLVRGVTEGWKIDAVLSYFSGNPDGVSCSIQSGTPQGAFSGQDGVGSGVPYRCSINRTNFPALEAPLRLRRMTTTSPTRPLIKACGIRSMHPASSCLRFPPTASAPPRRFFTGDLVMRMKTSAFTRRSL